MIRTVLASISIALVACSTADSSPRPVTSTSTPTTPAAMSPEQVAAAFDACADAAGADLPDLALDAHGRARVALLAVGVEILDPAVREAFARCSSILTEGGLLGLEGELRNRVMGSLREFAQCMRGEGVLAFPDPSPGFTGQGDPFPLDDVIRASPGFGEAADVCASQLADR